MNKQPNIFKYATSELTQDAFIVWLLRWADPINKASNEKMHALGLRCLQSLLAKQNIVLSEISNLTPHTQYFKIDVFVSFEMGGKKYGIIIEDKVHSTDHSNQLARYKAKIESLNIVDVIVPIYFKTGYQVNLNPIATNGYHYYSIKDLLTVLTSETVAEINHDVLTQYREYILQKEKDFDWANNEANKYLTAPLKEWTWWTCVRYFHEHAAQFGAGWGSVGNKREPLLAFYFGGIPLTILDADTNQPITIQPYLDMVFTDHHKIRINFRLGNLKNHHQTNSKNRDLIFEAFSPILTANNIKHQIPTFKKAKETILLANVKEIDKSLNHKQLTELLHNYRTILHEFVNEYTAYAQ